MKTLTLQPGDLVRADLGKPILAYVLDSQDPRVPNALRVPFERDFPGIVFLLIEGGNIASALPESIKFIRRITNQTP